MTAGARRKERTLPTRSAVIIDEPDAAEPPEGRQGERQEAIVRRRLRADHQDHRGLPQNEATPTVRAAPAASEHRHRRSRLVHAVVKTLVWTALLPILGILPVFLALRIAVSAHQGYMYDGWGALGIGVLAALLLISMAIVLFMLSFGIRRRMFVHFVGVCLIGILGYGGYALFHLPDGNAKTEEIRNYYTSLHPLLRIAVKNLTLVDGQLTVTDLHRTSADYRAMGLRPREHSMHFQQPSGYVHAVDIRTTDRSKAENLMVELYFVLMGFETMRHVGTADHLHVSLSLREYETLAASSVDEAACEASC